jgi:hypothetical protein
VAIMKPYKFNLCRALILLTCTAICFTACAETTNPDEPSEPEYYITSNRPSSQVTVSNEADSAIVEVFSDNGIGNASVELVSGDWPGSIVMRFHLQGLESLQFSYGDIVVDLSVNTQNMILQSVTSAGGTNETISKESDFWMPVIFFDREGNAEDGPTAGGIIEVKAPVDFLNGSYSEFMINWIDFYR